MYTQKHTQVYLFYKYKYMNPINHVDAWVIQCSISFLIRATAPATRFNQFFLTTV